MKGHLITLDENMVVILAMIRWWVPMPSAEEMMRYTDAKSKSTIHEWIKWLEKNGYVVKPEETRRAYHLTEKGMGVFPELILIPRREEDGGEGKVRPDDHGEGLEWDFSRIQPR